MANETKKLLQQVRELIHSARKIAVRGINTLQVITNFEIGHLIVEHEQKGKKRAGYGEQIIRELSLELTLEFGKGFSKSNLEYMRRFFIEYQDRMAKIGLKQGQEECKGAFDQRSDH